VCTHCHTSPSVDAFYKQYDDFVILYNEKFGKPGQQIMKALLDNGLRSKMPFDEEIDLQSRRGPAESGRGPQGGGRHPQASRTRLA
jgi:hypothetical protein